MNLKNEGLWALGILLIISAVLDMTGCTSVHHSSDPNWKYPSEFSHDN
jgi:uncharacterized protein YceK